MTFNVTPETINSMIKYGEALLLKDHWEDFTEYLESMIEKFFPDAHLNVINKMLEWAKYPTLPLISLNDLKELEIGVREKQFKESISTKIVANSTMDNHNKIIACINSGIEFGREGKKQNMIRNGKLTTWAKCLRLIESYPGFGCAPHGCCLYAYAENINSHASFINIVQSVWCTNLPLFNDQVSHVLNSEINTNHESCMEKVSVLNNKYNIAISELAELKKDHEQLKEQYHDLQYSTMLNTHSLKMLQPANPTYDYEAIKARKKNLHIEFRRVSKLMKLL